MTKEQLLQIKEKATKNLNMAITNNNAQRIASYQNQLDRVNAALKEYDNEFIQDPKYIKKYNLDNRKEAKTKQGNTIKIGQIITTKRGNKKYRIIGFNCSYAICRSLEGKTIKEYATYNIESYVII